MNTAEKREKRINDLKEVLIAAHYATGYDDTKDKTGSGFDDWLEANIADPVSKHHVQSRELYDLLEIVELVEAMQVAIEVADLHPQHEKYSRRWRKMLADLGETVPEFED